MSKERIEYYEQLLASRQQQLAELEKRLATSTGFTSHIELEVFDLRQQIEEIQYRIFSDKYPRLRNYRYYVKVIPNLLYCLLLMTAILSISILVLHSSENLYIRAFFNLFCVFGATTVLYIAARYFRHAKRKQKSYIISSIISENPGLFSEIDSEVSLVAQNEVEL